MANNFTCEFDSLLNPCFLEFQDQTNPILATLTGYSLVTRDACIGDEVERDFESPEFKIEVVIT